MYSGDSFDESFIRLLGLPLSTSQGAHILTAGLGSAHNPAEQANVAVLTPLMDALLSRGLKTAETDNAKELDTRNHGKHIAIISRQFFRDAFKGKELSVLTSAVSIDGHLLPLLPAWLTPNGLPKDFGTQTESFEYGSSCAALVINTNKNNRTCGIIASEHTQQHLKMQLKRACTNTGIWQGAKGHGFIDLLTIKSGLLALIGWNIDRDNQRFEHRQNDRCIGFSSIDSSTFPKVSGRAVIDPHQNTTTLLKNKKLYEVAFEVRLEPVWEIQGLDSEVLQLMEVTSTTTFGFNSIESSGLTKVEPWVAKAKPGSYLHTRAIHQADGNSETTANKIFALNKKDEEHRSENQSQYLIDGI